MTDVYKRPSGSCLYKAPFIMALLMIGAFSTLCTDLSAAVVKRISWDPPSEKYHKFIIEFDEMPKYNLVNKLSDSNFFYVDLYGLTLNYKRNLMEVENDPALKYVDALSYSDHGVLRLVFYAKQNNSTVNIETSTNPTRLNIYTVPPGVAAPGTPITSTSVEVATPAPTSSSSITQVNLALSTPAPPAIPIPQRRPAPVSSGGKKYVIVDPGHGGANSGAKSRIAVNGQTLLEKELAMQFAYELKKLLDESPNMTGLLTRVDDTNLGLYDRVKLAEQSAGEKGDNLFISLHLNDAPGNPSARGVEVYYLNQKGTKDAAIREIEEKENREVGLAHSQNQNNLLNKVMTSLQQDTLSGWQYESFIFCKRLEQSYLTFPYFAKHNRSVKNANFVVLKNFAMPAVLFEIGFMSNSDELRYLSNNSFQQATAALIYNAINAYFAENDPSFKPTYRPVPQVAQ